jgi:hypothetical protein
VLATQQDLFDVKTFKLIINASLCNVFGQVRFVPPRCTRMSSDRSLPGRRERISPARLTG